MGKLYILAEERKRASRPKWHRMQKWIDDNKLKSQVEKERLIVLPPIKADE